MGAPCCSKYPFNGRGAEDLLGPFGDCMLESFALEERASSLSRQPPLSSSHAPNQRVTASSSSSFGMRRRRAVVDPGLASVLVLDRDECDRRLADPHSLLRHLRGERFADVRHAFFERVSRADQLQAAASADLVTSQQ